jgi:5-methylcytosine-specific restriction endonuclease McrA
MEFSHLDDAVEAIEKANADLQPELLTVAGARERLEVYARARKLIDYGIAALAARVDDATSLARSTGASLPQATDTITTGKVLHDSAPLAEALRHGAVSLDQASEISKAERSAPGSATGLLTVANEESFSVLRQKARRVKLEAEQHRDLAERQHNSRSARSYKDDLGMVNIHLTLEPHVGTPLEARAEAEAARLAKAARTKESREPFERYLADAYVKLLSSPPTTRARRPELVVLVSHEVITRGWKDVKAGEICKIPGVGPIAPAVAREIARDAFLNGVFYDGVDLRHFARWTRNIPIEVTIALELGDPPEFDGVSCADCGNRFRTEFDHLEPRVARGPTSTANLNTRCWSCHRTKTERDRKAGKLTPPEP